MEQGSRYFLNEELAFFDKTVKKGTVLVVAGVFLAAAVWTGLSLPPHSTTGAFPFDLVVGVLGTTFDLLRAEAAHPVIVAILALLGLERALFWVRRRSWPSAATAGNLLSYLLGLFASGVTVLGFVQAYRWCYDHLRLFDPLGTPWAFCLALIGVDFILYWVHRLFHRVGFLWAVHSVHHSCQTMNASVALRQSWLFSFLIYLYFFLPLALLGINLMQLITASALTTAWGAMCHTTIIAKFGVLERFLNTPSNHRVHHGRQGRY
ncbi:MAG: sterol desaturase family protein, partial [Steroidobacteraceae bacterium]